MCFVGISEQTAIISLSFIPELESVYCAVRTGSLNKRVRLFLTAVVANFRSRPKSESQGSDVGSREGFMDNSIMICLTSTCMSYLKKFVSCMFCVFNIVPKNIGFEK